MDTKQLIKKLGGPKKVMAETGLSKGRISQWGTEDHVPNSWLKYFKRFRKDIPWTEYTGSKKH